MAVLKQIKFGTGSATPIAMTQVAIETKSQKALSVVGTNTGLDVNNDPVYTIGLAVDGKTITKTGDSGLATALALKVQAAESTGENPKKARIALVDSNGGSGYAELSSVNIEDIVGEGIVDTATYNPATGKLTITWVGDGTNTTEIDLGALLDIQDIVIADGSDNYLSFAAVSPAPGTDAGQAQIGVKLAEVTFTPTAGSTEANLSVDTANGSLLDAEETITAVKDYVDDVLKNASAELAVKAQGDAYVAASIDANDNKKVIVDSNVIALSADAGAPGTYGTDGSQTTAPTAATLSGTANSLADGADIATKVKTYVDGAIAIEAARSDAKNKVDIAALDVPDAAVAGQYVSSVSETDGKIAVSRLNVSDAVLNGYAKGEKPASTAIAATDDVKGAIAKLEHQIDDAKAAATTKVVEGTDAGNNMEITSATSETDGSTTYTINLTDVASKAALDAEIAARKAVDGQSGQTYAANSGTNYISDANSLNNADVKLDAALKAEETRAKAAEQEIANKVGLTGPEGSRVFTPTSNYGGSAATVKGNLDALDTQLKAVSDKLDGVQYKVNGTTLEFYGISEKTGA